MKKKILVPTDLTEAGDHAIRQATVIAKKTGFSLVLFHVQESHRSIPEDAEVILKKMAVQIWEEAEVTCKVLIKYGNIFDVIPFEASEGDYSLVVVATHGIRGFRQKIFGADILKLVSRIAIPTLVIQEQSEMISVFEKIVLPVSSHKSFNCALEATLLFAGMDQAEVFLYSVYKPGYEWPEQMMKNIEKTAKKFEKKGIKLTRVKEDQNVYSIGYSKQILNYAKSTGADMICIISIASKEYYYFAQSDKESILLNDSYLPVLCAGGIICD